MFYFSLRAPESLVRLSPCKIGSTWEYPKGGPMFHCAWRAPENQWAIEIREPGDRPGRAIIMVTAVTTITFRLCI